MKFLCCFAVLLAVRENIPIRVGFVRIETVGGFPGVQQAVIVPVHAVVGDGQHQPGSESPGWLDRTPRLQLGGFLRGEPRLPRTDAVHGNDDRHQVVRVALQEIHQHLLAVGTGGSFRPTVHRSRAKIADPRCCDGSRGQGIVFHSGQGGKSGAIFGPVIVRSGAFHRRVNRDVAPGGPIVYAPIVQDARGVGPVINEIERGRRDLTAVIAGQIEAQRDYLIHRGGKPCVDLGSRAVAAILGSVVVFGPLEIRSGEQRHLCRLSRTGQREGNQRQPQRPALKPRDRRLPVA